MKKIMFNDRYGLTQAVLERKKTMTRRIVNYPKKFKGVEDTMLEFNRRIGADIYYDCVVCDADGHDLGQLSLPYEVGDVVAIAQCYSNISDRHDDWLYNKCAEMGINADNLLYEAGWFNKMFVNADLMPHHIRITDLWFERLQNISDDDCLKEGVTCGRFIRFPQYPRYSPYPGCHDTEMSSTPQDAFRTLINRVFGPHT